LLSGSCPEIDVVWLYAGPEELAPDCPDGKPPIFEGRTDLDAPPCEECSCGPATCTLPDGISLHGTAGCAAPPVATFTPAAISPGICATGDPAVGMFEGITYHSPTLAPCAPSGPPDAPPVTWGLYGRVCEPDTSSTLFQECIEAEVCPTEFSVQRIFYSGFEDGRECGACACESPEGGTCAALVRVYQDANCTQMIQANSVSIDPVACFPMMPKNTAGSILVEWQETVAGTCKPVPRTTAGQATPIGPRSFCCRG
jgi:hypothetical protein